MVCSNQPTDGGRSPQAGRATLASHQARSGLGHAEGIPNAGMLNTPVKTVVADPPWTPALGANWKTRFTDKARPQKHYSVLGVEEIAAMAPNTNRKAHLWLWVLNQHVDWGYQVARAWGFEPQQMITWKKPGLGAGTFQCNSESVLVCRKGARHGNPFQRSGGTCFEWPRGRHSEKPEAFYDLVERVSPGPYLEMFARRTRLGWLSHGNEVPIRDSDASLAEDRAAG